MKKLLVVACFAAFATYPAAACDWTRAASASDPVVVAATANEPGVVITEQAPQAASAAPEARSVVVDESARNSISEQVPVVLITDRH